MDTKIEIRDIRKKEWFIVDNIYINGYAKLLKPLTALTYFALCRHVNNDTQKCFPGLDLLSTELNISKTTVIKAIKELETWNIIQVERDSKKRKDGHQMPNKYTLLDKSVWSSKDSRVHAVHTDSRVHLTSEQSTPDDNSRVHPVYSNNTNINNTNITKPIDLFSFDEFWNEYPKRRVDKDKCRIKFEKLPEETRKLIIEDVKNRKINDNKWIKDNMAYVPQTSTYLNNKKWLDDYEKVNKIISHDFRTNK